MAKYAEGVNPAVLRWARERAGYSLYQVAEGLKKEVEVVARWESGDEVPTYSVLEVLSSRYYKRPVALFFFPEPPGEPEAKEEFRTLPDTQLGALSPDTRLALREARALTIALRELTEGRNPSDRLIVRDLKLAPPFRIDSIGAQVRTYFGIDLPTQAGWRNAEQALREWRRAVEDAGVFVFKRSFKQDDVFGLCLTDPELPLICLNSSTSHTRQIFSLFHELTHLLLHSSGITLSNDSFVDMLPEEFRFVERTCNQLAAECLAPADDFESRVDPMADPVSQSELLASRYHVSREVILRKFLDRGSVSREEYGRMSSEWTQQFLAARAERRRRMKKDKKGLYYVTQASYLGIPYMSLAFGKYYDGSLDLPRLADYLNVKTDSVEGLERRFARLTGVR